MAYAYGSTITDVLNTWADMGVFAYLLPFLLIFAIVFGVLSSSKILGKNKAVHATIALAVGLLSLQFDYVANFFATIFPYAGIGLAVLLVALILIGLFGTTKDTNKWVLFGLGIIIFLFIMGYSFYDFRWIGSYVGVEWVPIIAVILIVVGAFVWMYLEGRKEDGGPGSSSTPGG
jgi:hypothetical protein